MPTEWSPSPLMGRRELPVGVSNDRQGGRGQARSHPTAVDDRAVAGAGADATTPAQAGRTVRPPSTDARRRMTFSRLVAAHDERLRSLAFRLLHDRDLVDEVLQDVYVNAYVALPGFRRRSPAATPVWAARRALPLTLAASATEEWP